MFNTEQLGFLAVVDNLKPNNVIITPMLLLFFVIVLLIFVSAFLTSLYFINNAYANNQTNIAPSRNNLIENYSQNHKMIEYNNLNKKLLSHGKENNNHYNYQNTYGGNMHNLMHHPVNFHQPLLNY